MYRGRTPLQKLLLRLIPIVIAMVTGWLFTANHNSYRDSPSTKVRPPIIKQRDSRERALKKPVPSSRTPITILSVVDGDTLNISLSGKTEHVRLIGIDAPEKEPNEKAGFDSSRLGIPVPKLLEFGRQASAQMSKLVSAGQKGFLEFDEKARDKYGRILGYVYTADNTFLNEEMVKRGYARTMRIAPNQKYSKNFERLAGDARQQNLGLWPSGAF